MVAVNDRLVWIDCEMTGLDLGTDALIEVAALVTDGELNVLGEGVDIIIAPPPAALEAMERRYTPDLVLVACNTLSVFYERTLHAKRGTTETDTSAT